MGFEGPVGGRKGGASRRTVGVSVLRSERRHAGGRNDRGGRVNDRGGRVSEGGAGGDSALRRWAEGGGRWGAMAAEDAGKGDAEKWLDKTIGSR